MSKIFKFPSVLFRLHIKIRNIPSCKEEKKSPEVSIIDGTLIQSGKKITATTKQTPSWNMKFNNQPAQDAKRTH